ncbi:MAG: YkgJ family cysteine cluster protein [Candidatus Omnitrophica bacterium]|nr:YkgJ family cysteine cluster protein [Candidatus Omnitrophota bacterium]
MNIFLTPYDILRLRKHLGVSSQKFLDDYTLIPIDRNQKYPVVLLKMSDAPGKPCPFVKEDEGCTVYENRPWACRMYPVGLASPKDDDSAAEGKFYFILREPDCEGFNEKKEWTIGEWIEDQGIEEYSELGEGFKEIILHERMQDDKPLDPKKMEMFFMVCYNIDSFRRFVFESRFLQMFEVDEFMLEQIKTDDVELMKFGFEWLKFSLFSEQTMKIRPDVLEAKKRELRAAQ